MARPAVNGTHASPAPTTARILTAAEAIFAVRGFDGVTARVFAGPAALNVSRPPGRWGRKMHFRVGVLDDALIAPLPLGVVKGKRS